MVTVVINLVCLRPPVAGLRRSVKIYTYVHSSKLRTKSPTTFSHISAHPNPVLNVERHGQLARQHRLSPPSHTLSYVCMMTYPNVTYYLDCVASGRRAQRLSFKMPVLDKFSLSGTKRVIGLVVKPRPVSELVP